MKKKFFRAVRKPFTRKAPKGTLTNWDNENQNLIASKKKIWFDYIWNVVMFWNEEQFCIGRVWVVVRKFVFVGNITVCMMGSGSMSGWDNLLGSYIKIKMEVGLCVRRKCEFKCNLFLSMRIWNWQSEIVSVFCACIGCVLISIGEDMWLETKWLILHFAEWVCVILCLLQ